MELRFEIVDVLVDRGDVLQGESVDFVPLVEMADAVIVIHRLLAAIGEILRRVLVVHAERFAISGGTADFR